MTLASLHRLRWAVRAILVLGVTVSVAANVLHARHDPIAQAIAAWPPLALLITVDLVSRVPVHRRLLGAVRILATSAIAAIAAFVSYGHMAGVTARYGETGIVPYLLPVSVDGLIVVASVSLVELAGQLHACATPTAEARTATATTALRAAAPGEPTAAVPRPVVELDPEHAAVPATMSVAASDQDGDKDAVDPDESEPALADAGEVAQQDEQPHQQRPGARHVPQRPYLVPPSLASDLEPLLNAARQARDELLDEGRAVTRDALAARLRANGHAIRTTRITELLAALKTEPAPTNGRLPTASG
jgi:hypothetical protein